MIVPVWVLVCSSAASLEGSVKDVPTGNTAKLLEQLANFAIASDPDYLGRRRLQISGNQIRYDAQPVPLGNLLQADDPLAAPLEALIRTKSLERDLRSALPRETFWIGPLRKISKSVMGSVDVTSGASLDSVGDSIPILFEELFNRLSQYSARENRELIGERSPAEGFNVTVIIEPANGRVQFVPFLLYKKNTLAGSMPEDQWRELFPGTTSLIGRYRYRATWSASSHVEEGSFEIREASKLTIRDHGAPQ